MKKIIIYSILFLSVLLGVFGAFVAFGPYRFFEIILSTLGFNTNIFKCYVSGLYVTAEGRTQYNLAIFLSAMLMLFVSIALFYFVVEMYSFLTRNSDTKRFIKKEKENKLGISSLSKVFNTVFIFIFIFSSIFAAGLFPYSEAITGVGFGILAVLLLFGFLIVQIIIYFVVKSILSRLICYIKNRKAWK